MDAVVAHYEKLNAEESDRKVAELQRKEEFFAKRAAANVKRNA